MGGGAEVLDTSTMENWEMGGGFFFGFESFVGYVCMYVCMYKVEISFLYPW